jgi:hypothetical protein
MPVDARPDGVWRGRWENFERMPVELRPVASVTTGAAAIGTGACATHAEAAAAGRVMEAVDRLTGTRHLYRRTGYNARPMEFRTDGGIGAGAAGWKRNSASTSLRAAFSSISAMRPN